VILKYNLFFQGIIKTSDPQAVEIIGILLFDNKQTKNANLFN
jgi:hypothetical protein